MRHAYVVTYDISDPKRLRRVYRLMLGWGDHLQLSVFQCELSARELVELRLALSEVVNHNEDQVLFCLLGPVDGFADPLDQDPELESNGSREDRISTLQAKRAALAHELEDVDAEIEKIRREGRR